MLRTTLGKGLLVIFLIMVLAPAGFYYYSGGQSLFPELPESTGPVLNPPTEATPLTPRSTPLPLPVPRLGPQGASSPTIVVPTEAWIDASRTATVAFINHTRGTVRVLTLAPEYHDFELKAGDQRIGEMGWANWRVYIFVESTVYTPVILIDTSRDVYVNIYTDRVIVGPYRLQGDE